MDSGKSIRTKEIVQVGDVFLLRFNCPNCNVEQFNSYPLDNCKDCQHNFEHYALILKTRRLVVGTRRKPIRFNKTLVRDVYNLSEGKCSYCSIDLANSEYHIDHIIAVSIGGSNNLHNLALSCPTCNKLVGAKAFNSLSAKRDYILSVRK